MLDVGSGLGGAAMYLAQVLYLTVYLLSLVIGNCLRSVVCMLLV